jgi:predicted DNA binding CopG/RHH family protein
MLSSQLLKAVRAAARAGLPYQRFIRESLEKVIQQK